MKRSSLIGACAIIAVLALAAPLVTTALSAEETAIKTDDELVAAIKANTPEKHQEIAAWYRAKAGEEKQKAEEHRKMSTAYVGSKAAYADQMHKHCDQLVSLHEKLAAQYTKLAVEHEAAAGRK